MNFFKNENFLSVKEYFGQLAEWEKSADPSVRFENNYYTLQRFSILHDYEEMLLQSDEPADDVAARLYLDAELEKLRALYIRDLELLFEMHMTMQNIFIPWRVKLQTVV